SRMVWEPAWHWYRVPPLPKLWLDKVLPHAWAYGHGGPALHGNPVVWAVTTGGGENHFSIGSHPGFGVLSQPLQAPALHCGPKWLPPVATHCNVICGDRTLKGPARQS
ncbi:NAD(P)H-dependent oxidoreductase, partial [Salmonella enterica]|uniref:NAD(P)H-dependent oxidoreductase n=1 Tax=Salmonella enterica TaxID=28901 RepID=UPI000A9A15F3